MPAKAVKKTEPAPEDLNGKLVKNPETGHLEGPIFRGEDVTPEYSPYQKLDEARALLQERHEYLAYGVHELMQPKITKAIPTAGVAANRYGGSEFFFNPTFIRSLTVEELAMVMAHEAYHVLLDHIKVRKENHKLWNICCDVIVNTLLLHEANFKIGAELQQMLWDAKKIDYPEHNLIHYISAEDLYDELEPQVKKVQKMMEQYDAAAGMANDMQPSNAKGTGPNAEANQKPETEDSSGQQNDPSKAENDPNDPRNSKGKDEDPQEYPWQEEEEPESSGATPDEHKGWGNINEGECDQIKRELKNNGTFDRAQKAGKTPAGIARAFEALEQPFNWQKILEKFIASVIKRRDTWERPNRRLVAAFPETRLPTQTTLHEHKILVYADMSGSIGPEEVSRFVSVLQKAPHEVKISAFSFDTKIYAWPGWDKGEMPRGGGGTSFLQVVRHAEEQKGNYDAIVVLTDGYDSEPSPKQPKKWLWVSTAAFPGGSYGEVVKKNQGKYKSGWWIKMPESGKKRRR